MRLFILIIIFNLYSYSNQKTVDSLYRIISETNKDSLKMEYLIQVIFIQTEINTDSALASLEILKSKNKLHNYPKINFSINNISGNIYFRKGDYLTAKKYYEIAFKQADLIDDISTKIAVSNNLGYLYSTLNDSINAVKYYEFSYQKATEFKKESQLLNNIVNYSNFLVTHNEFTKAIELTYKGIELANKLNKSNTKLFFYQTFIDYFIINNRLDSAEFYYNEMKYLIDELNSPNLTAMYNLNYGKYLAYRKNYEEAIQYISKSFDFYKKQEPQGLEYAYNTISNIYDSIKDYKNAYKYLQLHKIIFDSLNNIKMKEKIAEMELTKENELKDKEITKLKEMQRMQLELYISFALLFILLITIIIIISINSKKLKKLNNELKEKNSDLENLNKKLTDSEILLKSNIATKDKLFSLISHDLKSPMGSIKMTFNHLKTDASSYSGDEIKEIIAESAKQVNDTYALIENLLEWSRSQRAQITPVYMNININEIFDSIVSLNSVSIQNKNLKVEINASLETFVSDKNLIHTIIRNLFINAVKFTNPDGKVKLECYKSEENVILEIADSGVGMSQEKVDSLFNIETNKSEYGTKGEKGTGLGLLLVYEFVNILKGDIKVVSEIGKGTTFIISIPHINFV